MLGGSGSLTVSVDGQAVETVDVGGAPRLYTLYRAASTTTGTMTLNVSAGVQVYDFTFG